MKRVSSMRRRLLTGIVLLALLPFALSVTAAADETFTVGAMVWNTTIPFYKRDYC